MTDNVTRRDFVNGLSVAVMAAGLPIAAAHAQDRAKAGAQNAPGAESTEGVYPPLRQGLRGQYPGSFEIAHAARDGMFTGPVTARDTGEHYDLVIVGAGISGLSAAWFYRRALGPDAKILIVDNHDDFGGHAKRNEFTHEGKTYLSYGGTMSIESPFPYSYTAKALLAELGIVPSSYKSMQRPERLAGMSEGVFFDHEHFGADRLVAGYEKRPWAEFFKDAPLDADSRAALIRLYEGKTDYLPGMTPDARRALLQTISYETFLRHYAKLPDQAVSMFDGMGFRNNMRLDACPAYTAMRGDAPGFKGMVIAEEPLKESEFFHFPDGNASIARLLVSHLVPQVFGGVQTPENIVLAKADYSKLDQPQNPVRIRLGKMVVRVEHLGKPELGKHDAVRVVYQKPDGSSDIRESVTGANVILACFNNIIPYIAPEIPQAQKDALKYPSKVPMLYTSVLLRNWEALKAAGVSSMIVPHGYYPHVLLEWPTQIGAYESVSTPDRPVVVHMLRNPNHPGLPRKEQNRMGRREMLQTPFSEIEAQTRAQLQRTLGAHGFDEKKDILAITANRWPHGYAYTCDTLGDPDFPVAEQPHLIGRKPFGRVAIANADSGAAAFTNIAIDQAERAVQECLASRGYS